MPDAPLLDVRALTAFYGDFQALFGVSMSVAPGQVVAIIGANGAGKSTLLKSIAGLMPARRDRDGDAEQRLEVAIECIERAHVEQRGVRHRPRSPCRSRRRPARE